ncbi:mitochondrial fission factor homolog B-like isoform X1 [Phasianus colchicus]|uniref:mitochondrial fission factor homolog B-like isoform X1 n=1 Tax=Phasianus colchicus TaxID=9054 RepID=UPI00129DF97E|nr:mitochondrial fission factor homolog B-like isoform X1 [Phasianus colchicus]
MQYSSRGYYGESVCGDSLVLPSHPADSCSHPMPLPLPPELHRTPCSPAHLLWFCLLLLLCACRCLKHVFCPVQVSLSCLCNLGKTNKMWQLLEQKVNAARCDLLFTEDINRRMQVPNRLTVANSFSPVDEEPMPEGVPPSFPTHIPVRISLAASDADLRPILLDQQRNVPCTEVCVSLDSSAQHFALGELPFMHMAGRSSAQNRRRLGHHSSRSRRQSQHSSGSRRSPSDSTQLALPSPALHHERSQEVGAAPEEVIVAEAAAMKKELARISERLCVLEEQHKAWRKEEPLVYSMLLSACLVNTWLWLWR